jgi:DNA-binding transcriptional ArsR family regulator
MSNSFAEFEDERRRLEILRLLERSAELNEAAIGLLLRQRNYIGVSHAAVRIDLAWLKDGRLVDVEEIAGIQIVTLTQRGLETAQGIVTTPGVKRPSPQ